MASDPLVLRIIGRPSPWANGPHEAEWRMQIAHQTSCALSKAFDRSLRPSSVVVEFRMLPRRRGDLDNLAKPVLDTLFRQSRTSKHPVAQLFDCDDCEVHELVLRRIQVHSESEEGEDITIHLAPPSN